MVEAKALEWGSKRDMKALNPPFDLVVASDCVYKQDLFTPLLGIAACYVYIDKYIVLSIYVCVYISI